MPARYVLRMGHPILLERSHEIKNFNTPDLNNLIRDMRDTMIVEEGAGIAAPQIGILKRVVIFGGQINPRYPGRGPVPDTVLINPQIEYIGSDMVDDWEGCLSVPGMRGLVPRYKRIIYRGFDEFGNKIQRQAGDFHARVVQHECDHLDGILYPQRIKDMSQFGFKQELKDKLGC